MSLSKSFLERRVTDLEADLQKSRELVKTVAAQRELESERAGAYLQLLNDIYGGHDLLLTGSQQSLAEINTSYHQKKMKAMG